MIGPHANFSGPKSGFLTNGGSAAAFSPFKRVKFGDDPRVKLARNFEKGREHTFPVITAKFGAKDKAKLPWGLLREAKGVICPIAT